MRLIVVFFVSFVFFITTQSQANWFKNLLDSSTTSSELIERDGIVYDRKSAKKYTGKFEDKYDNGVVSHMGEYKDGLKHGMFESFHSNGKLKRRENSWFLGIFDGKIEIFHDNGTIKQTSKIKNGRLADGVHKIYNKNSEIIDLEFYSNMKSLNYNSHPNLMVVSDTPGWKRGEIFTNSKKLSFNNWGEISLFSRPNGIYGTAESLRDITLQDQINDNKFTGDLILIHKNPSNEMNFYKAVIPFKNGKINGKLIELNNSGNVSFDRKYFDVVQGKTQGKVITYSYENNKLSTKAVHTLVQNELDGPFEINIYINRTNLIKQTTRVEGNYKEGYKHGDEKIYYKDGTIKIIKYDDGTPLPNQ